MRTSLFTAALLVFVTGSAYAESVKFDPETGTGSVNRGTIQSAFGSKATEPDGAEEVDYQLIQVRTYRSQCRQRGNPTPQEFIRTRRERTVIESEVVTNPQGFVTGWDLTGKGTTVLTGRFCPKGWRLVAGTEPELLASSPYRLVAFFEDQRKVIWTAAAE